MEDIKAGEYVRTKNGKITKFIIKKNVQIIVGHGMIDFKILGKFENGFSISANNKEELYIEIDKYITKHSKNIIDLIEVGDIVFIQDVLNNDYVYIYDDEMLKAVKEDIEQGLQITEVLTHEQFEKNCYKVEGDKESK